MDGQLQTYSGKHTKIKDEFIDKLLDSGVSQAFLFIEKFIPLPLRFVTFPIEYFIRRRIKRKLRRVFDKVHFKLETKKVGKGHFKYVRKFAGSEGGNYFQDKKNYQLYDHLQKEGSGAYFLGVLYDEAK